MDLKFTDSNLCLNNKILKNIFFENHEKTNLFSYRLSEKQLRYLELLNYDLYVRGRCHPNVIISFLQMDKKVIFKFLVEVCAREHFDIDVYVDGLYYKNIQYEIKNLPFVFSVELEMQYSHIELFMSNLCSWEIVSIDGEIKEIEEPFHSERPMRKILLLGDSISQGMETNCPSLTYANLIYKHKGYEILNQSIGGICFDPHFLKLVPQINFDRIIIMLGTNDILKGVEIVKIKANIDAYFQELIRKFKRENIIVISPIHLLVNDNSILYKEEVVRKKIEENVKLYQLELIDGRTFFPRSLYFYYDDGIHPNEIGNFLMYDFIKKYL